MRESLCLGEEEHPSAGAAAIFKAVLRATRWRTAAGTDRIALRAGPLLEANRAVNGFSYRQGNSSEDHKSEDEEGHFDGWDGNRLVA